MLSDYSDTSNDDCYVEELRDLSDSAAAERIAEHFSSISCSYLPVQLTQLPAYLPCNSPPQVTEFEVYNKLKKIKSTRSTFPIDLPNKLRKKYSIFIASPLADIFNSCLSQNVFPEIWKLEYVTPIQKLTPAKKISDLRKIALSSDYSKLLESFLKDWILQDISHNLDTSQYGGRKGSGTEHLIVTLVDRVLKCLDSTIQKSAVIASGVDWSAAFDRLDPTLTAQKMVKIGVRPSVVSILVSYMTNRRMIVKYRGIQSNPKRLIGGGPQGTLLGGMEYIISNDCSEDDTCKDDRFKYYDDLNLLEFVVLVDKLEPYDFKNHVASDIGIDQNFLPISQNDMQSKLDNVTYWTSENMMLLNEKKSSYIVFKRSKSDFSLRLTLNGVTLERKRVIKILGIWLQEDLKWNFNTKMMCIKAYSRMNILNKLKYAGIGEGDLITIYKLFIRSTCEYCSAVFHTSLTQELSDKIEEIQKTALRIILSDKYTDYQSALSYFSIDTLSQRRQNHLEKFALKCTQDKVNQKLFPKNYSERGKDHFKVNFARTSQYMNSTVPQSQRLLNAMQAAQG